MNASEITSPDKLHNKTMNTIMCKINNTSDHQLCSNH